MYRNYKRIFYIGSFFILSLILGFSNLFSLPKEAIPKATNKITVEKIKTSLSINLPKPSNKPTKSLGLVEKSNDQSFFKEIKIKYGQGLMDALLDSGAYRVDAFNAVNSLKDHFDARKIQVGQKINLYYSSDGSIDRLEMQKDFDNLIIVQGKQKNYSSVNISLQSQVITRHVFGQIDDSLFLAAQRKGLPQIIIANLISIFSYDVDFQREIRKGDQFEIIYERKLSKDGRSVQEGNILFAKLTLSGKEISLFRHTPTESGIVGYFHEDGQSSKRALMKTPIEGARLSSYYGNRKHPVLGYNRMHKGIDFSAPTGTPIMAAGDGVVERASWYGSFGNYVRIRHNGTYKTIYAHMSKYGRGIKKGVRVQQGQIIGYVGATGRVTGRHLHYEVHMNGTQVNPLTLKIPSGIKLNGEEFQRFRTVIKNKNQIIMEIKSNILLTRATN